MDLYQARTTAPQARTPTDPVCGAPVPPVPIAYHADHADRDYYFCSLRCQQKFMEAPDRYAARFVGE